MIGPVTFPYLLHPLPVRDQLTGRASRQITKYERVVRGRSLLRELGKQDNLQAADSCLVNRTRVMGDQTCEPIVSAQLAEEPRAIDRVKACIDQIRGIPNVVKPCSSDQDVSSDTRDR